MSALIDMAGQRVGRLTVLHRGRDRKSGAQAHATWWCDCECGTFVEVAGNKLRCGEVRSCGCLKRSLSSQRAERMRSFANPTTHGASYTAEYRSWSMMKNRCTNPRCPAWKYYGGRGIKVCDEWRRSFESFLAHVGRKPTPRHSIDRINNDGDYEPGNVRWATPSEQVRNSRKVLR